MAGEKEGEVAHRPSRLEPDDLERRRGGIDGRGDAPACVGGGISKADGETRDLPTHHQSRQLVGRRLVGLARRDHASCTEDRDPVGVRDHLVQVVGDENDRGSLGRHRAKTRKKLLGFERRQRCRVRLRGEPGGGREAGAYRCVTRFLRTPMPSSSTSTVSPAFICFVVPGVPV